MYTEGTKNANWVEPLYVRLHRIQIDFIMLARWGLKCTLGRLDAPVVMKLVAIGRPAGVVGGPRMSPCEPAKTSAGAACVCGPGVAII